MLLVPAAVRWSYAEIGVEHVRSLAPVDILFGRLILFLAG
jgi:hypothetical protein